jgi:hypothetical protein
MARKRRRPQDPITRAINQFTSTLNNQFDTALRHLIDNLITPPEIVPPIPTPPFPQSRPGRPPRPAAPQTTRQVIITLYDILEVSPRASKETIDAAYKSLSKRFHPDNLKTGDAERMRQLNAAHSILGDAKKRKEYDKLLRSTR